MLVIMGHARRGIPAECKASKAFHYLEPESTRFVRVHKKIEIMVVGLMDEG